MKTVNLSEKEFREKFGEAGERAMTARSAEGEVTTYFPGKSSTETRLHEEYHATISPRLEKFSRGEYTPIEIALEELSAEEYVAGKMGQTGISGSAISGTAWVLLNHGYSPSTVMGLINRGLKTLGYRPLDRESRSNLRKWIRDYQREGKL